MAVTTESAGLEVLNPATGESIASVPNMSADEVDAAVERAQQALPEWLDATPGERVRAAAEARRRDCPTTPRSSRRSNRATSASRSRSRARRCRSRPTTSASSPAPPATSKARARASTSRATPRWSGASRSAIVAGICPWNYPLMMAVWKMGPALAAGNAQILKPAEQTPLSLLRFLELAKDVIPDGVLQAVTGDGVPTGARLVSHPGIGLVSLTGDVSTGQADREERGRHAQARAPRARRQGADGRLRRRRPRGRRRGHQDRRLRELGAGLHRRLTRDRRPEDLRRADRGARPGGRVAERRRPGVERGHRDGPGDLGRPAGADLRLPRAREGRDGADRRQVDRATAAGS